MNSKQIEQTADILKWVGIATLTGSAGDLVISGERFLLDLFGMAAGVIMLGVSIWLMGKVE